MKRESPGRVTRREVGHLAARTAQLPLEMVKDPRSKVVTRTLRQLLSAVVIGMAAGCKGLAEVERLTERMAPGARRATGLGGRVPDTTMNDVLVRLDPEDLRCVLHSSVRCAHRRKQLEHDLPIRAVSMDGKCTSTTLYDDPQAKVKYGQMSDAGHALVRTITSCLVSTVARPCLDAHPVPPETNEMGAFEGALTALLKAYDRTLFDLVMYDSGACSLANASLVKSHGLDYLFCLTENQPTLLAEATRLLGKRNKPLAQSTSLQGSKVVVRSLQMTDKMAGWLDWGHLQTVVKIETCITDKTTKAVAHQTRYYVTSLPMAKLKSEEWLELIRRRWSVENENHNTFDRILREDERPWLRRPRGMLVIQLLRRVVYNLLSLYRSVTTRSESKRQRSWTDLLQSLYASLLQATQEVMAGVRRRAIAAN